MADTLVKNPKLIVGTQSQVEAEMGIDDIGFATDIEFYTARQIDELLSKAGGASLPILMRMWSDHLLNDVSWLRADTFSWQSGDVYVAAYEHLVADSKSGIKYYAWARTFDGEISYTTTETPKTNDITYYKDTDGEFKTYRKVMEVDTDSIYDSASYELVRDSSKDETAPQKQADTIGDITITYYQAEDGHKICLPDQESNIVALHEKTGAADYYLLDTENKQFKLPRKQKRTLIQAVKNTDGTWFNLYSNGWVEQGGETTAGGTITLPVEMSDAHYTVTQGIKYTTSSQWSIGSIRPVSTTTINVNKGNGDASWWHVCGYAAESAYASAGMNLEYYYVGTFSQEAVEQTAGLNAEMFNGKADRNLLNTTDNVDIVVESQLPTSTNGYTWYRKYKSGWVEQGGVLPTNVSSVTLPIEMSDSNYMFQVSGYKRSDTSTMSWNYISSNTQTATGFTIAASGGGQRCWEVKGFVAA